MARRKPVAECPLCAHPLTYDEAKLLWGRATGQLSRGVAPEDIRVQGLYCEGQLTYDQLKSLWGKATSARRKTFGAGTGRPKSTDRCPCGAMTKARATARNHICTAPVKRANGPTKPRA